MLAQLDRETLTTTSSSAQNKNKKELNEGFVYT